LTGHALADQHDIAHYVVVHGGSDVLSRGAQRGDRHIAEFHGLALPGRCSGNLVPYPRVVEQAVNQGCGRMVGRHHARDRVRAGRR
jgi:hypothetical protein